MDILRLDRLRNEDLKQKCRFRWAVEGDENSRFFHSILKNKYAKCSIKGIHINGIWVDSPEDIKDAAFEHFASSYDSNGFFNVKVLSKVLDKQFYGTHSLGVHHKWNSWIPKKVNIMIWKVSLNRLATRPNLSVRGVDIPSLSCRFCDSVNEDVEHVLINCKMISSCLSSASISVLINRSPSKEFYMERGLRQGDPLSPFLFLIVTEALQVTILKACELGLFKGVCLANSGNNISLLQFADDALFFREWTRLNASNLINILRCFELGSGLKVNLDKSKLYGVGVPTSEGVIDRIRDRLSTWKAKSLSVSGRLTLIKSVLGVLPIYYLSLFKAPVKVIKLLDTTRFGAPSSRNFMGRNGGFESLVNIQGENGVWIDIIKALKSIEEAVPNYNSSFVSKNCRWGKHFIDRWCNDGSRLKDKFPMLFALESFKDCKVKDRGQVINGSWVGSWDWRIPPRGRAIDDMIALTSSLSSVMFASSGCDKWVWSYDSNGFFNVKVLSKVLDKQFYGTHSLGVHHKWNSWIPKKVNIMIWKVSLNRLATRPNLSVRGVDIPSLSCRFCDSVNEDVEHVLINCKMQMGFGCKWRKWISSCLSSASISVLINRSPSKEFYMERGLRQGDPLSPFLFLGLPQEGVDIANGNIKTHGCSNVAKAINEVFQISLWAIWNWRNRFVHALEDDKEAVKNEDIFSSIQRLSKLWMSARIGSKLKPDWTCWVARPFNLFS
ncbi:RNA-directed DNA polymerase, eukaryota [Tanacetum coccineum]|uniref:RNA-directed DNA polymerase, eukaryota n=1 Tax=Tanacetum coccineum TaxID=301880 RepID=A0ABQ5GG12_9ASTR